MLKLRRSYIKAVCVEPSSASQILFESRRVVKSCTPQSCVLEEAGCETNRSTLQMLDMCVYLGVNAMRRRRLLSCWRWTLRTLPMKHKPLRPANFRQSCLRLTCGGTACVPVSLFWWPTWSECVGCQWRFVIQDRPIKCFTTASDDATEFWNEHLQGSVWRRSRTGRLPSVAKVWPACLLSCEGTANPLFTLQSSNSLDKIRRTTNYGEKLCTTQCLSGVGGNWQTKLTRNLTFCGFF